jgi:putative ABC transport system permease protein
MIYQSWGRNLRRKALAVLTVFLATSLISALLAISIDIGDKMSRELKSYGANILIEPAGQAALPALFSEQSNPLASDDFLDESELANIKDIFWRNNIVGFAPCSAARRPLTGTISAYSGPSSASRSRYRMKRAMRPGSARSVRSGR